MTLLPGIYKTVAEKLDGDLCIAKRHVPPCTNPKMPSDTLEFIHDTFGTGFDHFQTKLDPMDIALAGSLLFLHLKVALIFGINITHIHTLMTWSVDCHAIAKRLEIGSTELPWSDVKKFKYGNQSILGRIC